MNQTALWLAIGIGVLTNTFLLILVWAFSLGATATALLKLWLIFLPIGVLSGAAAFTAIAYLQRSMNLTWIILVTVVGSFSGWVIGMGLATRNTSVPESYFRFYLLLGVLGGSIVVEVFITLVGAILMKLLRRSSNLER